MSYCTFLVMQIVQLCSQYQLWSSCIAATVLGKPVPGKPSNYSISRIFAILGSWNSKRQWNHDPQCLHKHQKDSMTYWCLAGNGWEWGNGIINHNYYGFFPHSLRLAPVRWKVIGLPVCLIVPGDCPSSFCGDKPPLSATLDKSISSRLPASQALSSGRRIVLPNPVKQRSSVSKDSLHDVTLQTRLTSWDTAKENDMKQLYKLYKHYIS